MISFVCMCFSIHNISYAGVGLNNWLGALTDINNAKEIVTEERNNYHTIRGDLETLIGEWDDNEQSNKDQTLINLIAAGGAIVGVASGGLLYPAAYVLLVTAVKAGFNNYSYNVNKSDYLASMSSLLPLMDTARANVDAAYNGGTLQIESGTDDTPGYVPEYDAYLTMAVGHLNAYEYDTDHNYNTEETIKFDMLEPYVKGGSHSGWHHENSHDGDGNKSRPDHTFTKFKTFDNFEVEPDLPLNYECKGDGEELFRTPYEAFYYHKAGCEYFYAPDGTPGCNEIYYSCDTDYASEHERHRVRICSKS